MGARNNYVIIFEYVLFGDLSVCVADLLLYKKTYDLSALYLQIVNPSFFLCSLFISLKCGVEFFFV